jgi:hypothetical protein
MALATRALLIRRDWSESAAKLQPFQALGPGFEILGHVLEDLAGGLYVHMLGKIAAALRFRPKVRNLIPHPPRTN